MRNLDDTVRRSWNGYVGAFVANEPSNPGDTWYSFCTDLTASLKIGTSNYDEIRVTSEAPVASEGWLTPWNEGGMQAAAAIYKAHASGMPPTESLADRKAYGAALQLAIWEALYDTDPDNVYNAASGRFRASIASGSTVETHFNTFMNTPVDDFDGVFWLKPDPRASVQGNLRLVSVPEPAMLLSSLLALGLAWVGRRRLV